MNQIVAIVGMAGGGKSLACEYLEKKGYQNIHCGDVIINKLKEENKEITPHNEKIMRERLRQEHGMGAVIEALLPKIKKASAKNNVLIDSLYSWEELLILQKHFKENLIVIGILTDRKKRYERMSKRKIRPFTYQEALERDISEIENLTKGSVIAIADYYIFNNGNIDDYYKRLEEIINTIKEVGED